MVGKVSTRAYIVKAKSAPGFRVPAAIMSRPRKSTMPRPAAGNSPVTAGIAELARTSESWRDRRWSFASSKRAAWSSSMA